MDKKDRKLFQELLQKPNVVAVGYGTKKSEGIDTKENAIVVHVSKKVPIESLSRRQRIPEKVKGRKTDVIEVGGEIRLFKRPPVPPRGGPKQSGRVVTQEITARERPARAGCSIGHKNITAGTFGAVVYNRKNQPFILSNNHVLANVNQGDIGDEILQPGPYDGGKIPGDVIARLDQFIEIGMLNSSECPFTNALVNFFNNLASRLGKDSRISAYRNVTNKVDCALAIPMRDSDIDSLIPDFGVIAGVVSPKVGMAVMKRGRTTEITKGKIDSIGNMVNVNMGDGQIAIFEDQVIISGQNGTPFSAGGDSGSLILTTAREAVCLLFAGNDTITIGNDINNVLEALDVSFNKR